MDSETKDQENGAKPDSQETEQPAREVVKSKEPKNIPIGPSRWQRFRGWYTSNKKLSIPATILLILVFLFICPWSRYEISGLFIKKDFTIKVIDSSGHTPVSGAEVISGGVSSLTDGNGNAKLHLSVGHHTLLITKKYYRDTKINETVPILSQKKVPSASLTATGRQAKVVVKNLVTKKVLANVDISFADTTAKTDNKGEAIVVVPADSSSLKAKLGLDGYNDADITIKASDSKVLENDFNLTPAGKVYFLSKRTGRLDVMKSNLDGTSAQVVIAGTGSEHDYDTVLMPSTDWKYVALLAKRSPSDPGPQLYVLSTSDDKLLSADGGNASFTLKGWAGDNLIYYVTRNDVQPWQPGKDKLKSYDAGSGKITLLDQSSATGDSSTSAYEYYALVSVSDSTVVYAKNWTQVYSSSPPGLLAGKQNSLSTIAAGGQNHKIVANYDAQDNVQYAQHTPNAVYVWQQSGSNSQFYDYVFGLPSPKPANISGDQFYQAYPVYYSSPSGKQTFWGENRDGKTTLFIGDENGDNPSTIATLSEFTPYGWYGNDYLLMAKHSSELYVMGSKGGEAIKITDYQPTTGFGY